MANLPNPDHDMFFGYMAEISYQGDFRPEIQSTVNLQMNWAYVMLGDLSKLNSSFNAYSGPFIFGPDVNPADTTLTLAALASLDTAAPYWSNIDYVYFDEMSHLDKPGLQAFIQSWKDAETARGLSHKPIMVSFPFITGPGSWQANNIDYVGIECYMDPSHQNDGDLVTQMNNAIDTTLAFTGPRNVFFILQAYDRHGAWTNYDSLKAIQTPPYLKGYNNSVVKGILAFSYGYFTGTDHDTRNLPQCIRTEHLRIWNAVNSTTQPDSISCSGITPTPDYFYIALACGNFCKQLICNIPKRLSGLYKLVPGKKNDTLYLTILSPTDYTTQDTAIPDPMFQTGPAGDEQ